MHRRRPCNACWPDDLPMIKFKFLTLHHLGQILAPWPTICVVLHRLLHISVSLGTTVPSARQTTVSEVSVSIAAACPTLHLMLPLHPLPENLHSSHSKPGAASRTHHHTSYFWVWDFCRVFHREWASQTGCEPLRKALCFFTFITPEPSTFPR